MILELLNFNFFRLFLSLKSIALLISSFKEDERSFKKYSLKKGKFISIVIFSISIDLSAFMQMRIISASQNSFSNPINSAPTCVF